MMLKLFVLFSFLGTLSSFAQRDGLSCFDSQKAESLETLKPILQVIKDQASCDLDLPRKNLSRRDYFEKLLAKGIEAPLKDFLELWNPEEKEHEKDPYFFECEKEAWGNLSKTKLFGISKFMVGKCKPDVLYTWGSDKKLDNIKKTLVDGQRWKGEANPFTSKDQYAPQSLLYLALTPAATFAYGSTLVRVKIKDGTPFRSGHHKAKDGQVWFWKDKLGQDFTISDSSVIESWSYGTAEIYDELVRDLKRIESDQRAQLYFYDPKDKDEKAHKGLDKLLKLGLVDDAYFTEETLKKNMLSLISRILKDEGAIHFQKGSCRGYEAHYSTKKPTYFNPN
jgi:hypothetical protein